MVVLSVLVCILFLAGLANVHAQAEEDSRGYNDYSEMEIMRKRMMVLFNLMDVNRDRELGQSELESWISSFRQKAKERFLKKELARISELREPRISVEDYLSFDTDKTPISYGETQTRRRDFQSSDANRDGFIDAGEAPIFLPKVKQTTRRRVATLQTADMSTTEIYMFEDFVRLQTGAGTSSLSAEEIEKYKDTDLNKDGVIQKEEIWAVAEIDQVADVLEEYSREKLKETASSLIRSVGDNRDTISYEDFTGEKRYMFDGSILTDYGYLLYAPGEYTGLESLIDPALALSSEDAIRA